MLSSSVFAVSLDRSYLTCHNEDVPRNDRAIVKEPCSNRRLLCLLFFVIAAQVVFAAAWIRIDRTPPYWDEAWYLYQGAVQLDELRTGGLQAWSSVWLNLDSTRPSLVSTLTIPFFALLGVSDDSGLIVNLAALVLLSMATYGLGRVTHSGRAGLMATIVAGCYPVLIGLTHILLVEMVMVALVAATLYALLRCDGLNVSGWLYVAGLLTGLGMLTKVFFGVFVAGPWLFVSWQALRGTAGEALRTRWCRLGNLLGAFIVAVATTSTWYGHNWYQVIRRSFDAAVGAEGAPYGPGNPLAWRNLLAYFTDFIGTAISPLGFGLLLLSGVGLALAWIRWKQERAEAWRVRWRHVLLLVSCVLPGYVVFSLLRNQDMKHVTGILPALAVLTGLGLAELLRRRWAFGTALLLGLMIGQLILGSFPGPLEGRRVEVSIAGESLLLLYPAQSWMADTRYAAANSQEWSLLQVLDYATSVTDLEAAGRSIARVAVIPDFPGLEEHALRFEAYRRQLPIEVVTAHPDNITFQDVLISKTGDPGWGPRRSEADLITAMLNDVGSEFHRLPRTFALPDGSEVVLYGRSSPLLEQFRQPMHAAAFDFGAAARLLGFDYGLDDGLLQLTMYWESLAATDEDYSVFLHLLDPSSGEVVAQGDHLLFPRIYPTSEWQGGALSD